MSRDLRNLSTPDIHRSMKPDDIDKGNRPSTGPAAVLSAPPNNEAIASSPPLPPKKRPPKTRRITEEGNESDLLPILHAKYLQAIQAIQSLEAVKAKAEKEIRYFEIVRQEVEKELGSLDHKYGHKYGDSGKTTLAGATGQYMKAVMESGSKIRNPKARLQKVDKKREPPTTDMAAPRTHSQALLVSQLRTVRMEMLTKIDEESAEFLSKLMAEFRSTMKEKVAEFKSKFQAEEEARVKEKVAKFKSELQAELSPRFKDRIAYLESRIKEEGADYPTAYEMGESLADQPDVDSVSAVPRADVEE